MLSDVVHTTPNLLTIMDTGAYPTEQPEVTHVETAVHPETIEAAVMFARSSLRCTWRSDTPPTLATDSRSTELAGIHTLAQILGDCNESPAQRS